MRKRKIERIARKICKETFIDNGTYYLFSDLIAEEKKPFCVHAPQCSECWLKDLKNCHKMSNKDKERIICEMLDLLDGKEL